MEKSDYNVFNVPLENVRNKNEQKIIQYMNELIPQFPEFDYCAICIQDVYALSLNQLLPMYAQAGSIILKKELQEEDFRDVVEAAVEQVTRNTNHPAR